MNTIGKLDFGSFEIQESGFQGWLKSNKHLMNGTVTAPTGYEYREYKNWRAIPKPRRCPFCKQAKGEIRKG